MPGRREGLLLLFTPMLFIVSPRSEAISSEIVVECSPSSDQWQPPDLAWSTWVRAHIDGHYQLSLFDRSLEVTLVKGVLSCDNYVSSAVVGKADEVLWVNVLVLAYAWRTSGVLYQNAYLDYVARWVSVDA